MDANRESWSLHSYPLQSSPSQKRSTRKEKKVQPHRLKPAYPIQSSPSQDPAAQLDAVSIQLDRTRRNSQQVATKSAYPIQSSPSERETKPEEEVVAVSTAKIARTTTLKVNPNSTYPIQSSPPSSKTSQKFRPVPAYPIQTSPSNKKVEKNRKESTTNSSETTATSANASTPLPRVLRAVRSGRECQPKGRTILICLDGTGDQFDADNSNIVHLVSCLKKDDPSQLTYYQSGVGTYDGGGLSNGMSAAADMAVASGLGVHIRDAYRFLMQNYNEGDKICLFGFSRGAYTARCLAGMVHKVGLLPAHNGSQIAFAYRFYKDDSPEGWRSSTDFKKTFCIDVNVHFIGVFDSVASVGFIPRKLPLSSTPYNRSTYFRHAMALDEHRAKFKACRFKTRDSIYRSGWKTVAETGQNLQKSHSYLDDRPAQEKAPRSSAASPIDSATTAVEEKGTSEKKEPIKNSAPAVHETDVLEVWFAGCHCDVGGGAVRNDVRHKLSHIPLRWMIRQCFECDTGILFNTQRLAEQGLDVHTLWPTYTALRQPETGPSTNLMQRYKKGKLGPIEKRSDALEATDSGDGYNIVTWPSELHKPYWVPEQDEDYFDAMADVHDQLSQAKTWWILELFWPIKVRVKPQGSDAWVKKVSVNYGRFRPVQETEPNLHWTVQRRMTDKGYKTRTRTDRNVEWKIVT